MAKKPKSKPKELFVVRLFDGFDGLWIDITKPVSKAAAQKEWDKRTEKGTKNTKFGDIDYYAIFPADTKMHFSAENYPER